MLPEDVRRMYKHNGYCQAVIYSIILIFVITYSVSPKQLEGIPQLEWSAAL